MFKTTKTAREAGGFYPPGCFTFLVVEKFREKLVVLIHAVFGYRLDFFKQGRISRKSVVFRESIQALKEEENF